MDDSETYMNVNYTKTDTPSPSRADPEVSYVELNIKTLSAPRFRTDEDGLNSTYSELDFRKVESRIDVDEDPPISSGSGGLSTTPHRGAHKQEPKQKIGNRSYRKICLLCSVTSVLVAIVAGLSIYVSQIRHSLITCDREHHEIREQYQEMNMTQRQCRLQVNELNSGLESSITENSRLALSRSTCLKNISVLNNKLLTFESKLFVLENQNSVLSTHLSELSQTQTDLRQRITDFEIAYRTLLKANAQICELLASRKAQTCSKKWISHEDRCYFISKSETYYEEAKKECSKFNSRILQIHSVEEEAFVSNFLCSSYRKYWIGKCKFGNGASNLVYVTDSGKVNCIECKSPSRNYPCNGKHRFICEAAAPLYPDIPENIQNLCQQHRGADLNQLTNVSLSPSSHHSPHSHILYPRPNFTHPSLI